MWTQPSILDTIHSILGILFPFVIWMYVFKADFFCLQFQIYLIQWVYTPTPRGFSARCVIRHWLILKIWNYTKIACIQIHVALPSTVEYARGVFIARTSLLFHLSFIRHLLCGLCYFSLHAHLSLSHSVDLGPCEDIGTPEQNFRFVGNLVL